ncbi:hypothetical protein [Bacillus sp. FJAT-29937]|uniref:hypothetical protein n=1 Tax=Bacillus sp. FJAT-29937 TaxID=1720553 RepID=UPI000829EE91|nr:hypothetical protein [Bacillus sp. FJAT-29937]
MPLFKMEKMKNFVNQDRLLNMVYKDLCKRNSSMTDEEVLEIVFNSYVLGDSVMEDIYSKL